MFASLKNRFPSLQQVLAIYGVISLILCGWTLIWFFWKLPSWEFFMTTGEIATVLAYAMATNFLESCTVLLLPLFLCVILPAEWFKDSFLSRASALVVLGLGYIMYISSHIYSSPNDDSYPTSLVRLIPVIGLLILLLTFVAGRIRFLRRPLEGLADRATIFSYILLPVGFISLLVVIIRNAF
ncbi:MAG TPA: hypothetical protein VLZ89_00790 [Anaerolineales bacterium]|nr:hypothetical protein [Anaerolineales bacterium]